MRQRLQDLGVGVMAQPRSYGPDALQGWSWAADNGCFADTWDADTWLAWLRRMADVPGCLWATVPDVVGDADATRRLFDEWADTVAGFGYRLAYVAQDGATVDGVPWGRIDCLFVGGTTEFKLSPDAERLARHAKAAGLTVHMGRVNSLRRMQIAESWGVDTCDGTFLAFGPDANVPRLERMLRTVMAQPSLFGGAA